MFVHNQFQLDFRFFSPQTISLKPVEENLSTDAGLLIFRQWDEQQELTKGFAEQLNDRRRDPDHTTLEMVRSRLFGILAGYEDQNDHDALRTDAIFKLLANRLPEDDDLFRLFYTSKTQTGDHVHMGIGLHVVQEVIAHYGGKVAASRLDHGALFEVELPLLAT